ncbi:G-type lectin S-receptor-like serine/threonine-protein kinase At2g19130 [Cryptomeria japonica]|uniref:G-type lectin S-receptor-like serine/threonine-protein kinase At2g19130 n=1 Tax=Cryptomeria japonica TaxID=3369 RepID=UPI0027DA1DE7|nr:G-type lectin S-receptor-like serine/threonine-protein kinase At2g19130 [Cryptomeria japonica]
MWERYRPRQPKDTCEGSLDSSGRMFSYKELKIATINFKSKLGSGGFGSVFIGSLAEGTLVAVKKLEGSKQHEKQFRAEISSLGSIQHGNLIRLRGFCAEGSESLLVYNYMPNGSLNSLLFKSKPKVLDWKTRFQIALGFLDESNPKIKPKVLDWKSRFKIALGTARGLVYLHEECRDCIIHGDIKPENILLDGNFSPKLADFGLSKLVGRDFSNVLTTTRGTRGFGITLLEIISGRISLDLSVQDSNQYYFPAWAAAQICQGKMINIVDENVAAEADVKEVRRASVVGLLCIETEEEKRPSMEQIMRMGEGKMEPQTLQMLNSAVVENQANRTETESDSDSNDSVFIHFLFVSIGIVLF